MKLYYSASSPFVRKVATVIEALALGDRVERVTAAAHPVDRNRDIIAHNPLGQVPTLVLDDGTTLADSRVISEYLDDLAGGGLFPRDATRWRVLTELSTGDGICAAALLARYERHLRPAEHQWDGWEGGQLGKVADGLEVIEAAAPGLGDRFDIGTIAYACALGYLDFRFGHLGWRERHPAAASWFDRFDARPAMAATRPPPA